MLGLLILNLLGSLIYLLIFGTLEPEFAFGLGLFLLVYLLSRSPQPYLGEYTVVGGITGIVIFVLVTRGGEPQNLGWVLMPILLAVILLPLQASLAFTLLNIGIPLVIVLNTPQIDLGVIFSVGALILFVSTIALVTKYSRQRDRQMLKQQARALAKSKARYKQLVDDVPIGLFESTVEGEILQANPAFLQILHIPDQKSLQTTTARELYANPAEREKWLALTGTHGALDEFEVQLVRVDGQEIWVREQVRVVRNQVGEISHIRGSMEDVTQRRWLQNQLTEQHQKIQEYAAELELSNAELDAFSHTVAHDLRRPLTHVVSYANLIRQIGKDQLTPETAEFLVRIEKSAMKMSEMIQGLLMLAQLRQTGEIIEPVQMFEVVTAAVQRIQPDIQKRGVQVNVEQPIPDALGYAPWLEEVLANLISNAVQYIGQENPAPTITIRAETLNDGPVRYEVIDNGLGIPPEHQPHLFDMLTRFHTGESSGTGLGLSIVKRIINKLDGSVGAESQPGHGSTFWFTLPHQ
jgi:PAS domain S-box-containing protein